MDIIKVVSPSLDDYAKRANAIALRNDRPSFLMLKEVEIEDEAERNEFTFIMKAVGDQLLAREWEELAHERSSECSNFSTTFEPEMISGSTFWVRANVDSVRVCRAY